MGCEFLESLGNDRGLPKNRHEVGVTVPAGDDVNVEVFGNAGAGDLAESI